MKNNPNNIGDNIVEDANKASSTVMRKCCACGKIIDRRELLRIMRDSKTGEVIINPGTKQFGRSIYLCKNSECLKLAQKKKRLKNLSDEQVEILSKLINTP